jgi:hypothetical protein
MCSTEEKTSGRGGKDFWSMAKQVADAIADAGRQKDADRLRLCIAAAERQGAS